MTMIEILVALGILAVAIGSILTIFHAGARHGARAREKMEAGRVALSVFDLVDKGFTVVAGSYGRDAVTAGVIDSELDGETYSGGQATTFGADDFVTKSPVPLVWEYTITSPDPATTDGVQLHRLSVTVAVDDDGATGFSAGDRRIRTYEAILADRRVTP